MSKYLLLLLLAFNSLAQQGKKPEYISMDESKIYDVEIIVFSYKNALPNSLTYKNKPVFNTEKSYELKKNTDNLPFIKANNLALTWFELSKENYQLGEMWAKLRSQKNIKTHIHKAWRLPTSPFEHPQYVNISNLRGNYSSIDLNNTVLPNNSINGMVALSKGRYIHFGHQLNLFKSFSGEQQQQKSMVFSLEERKQIKSGELHYFDTPWLATIVKITQFKGE